MMQARYTLRNTESRAAEYLKFLSSLSYSRRRFLRLLSTFSSSISPTGFDFLFSLTRPSPSIGREPPRNDSNAPERRDAIEKNSLAAGSEAFGCRLRTEKVPSDMPAAICVSSGCKKTHQHIVIGISEGLLTEMARHSIGAGYRIVCTTRYVLTSYTFTIWSRPPVSTRLASELNASDVTVFW